MESSFELFDHTADMGIHARAATLPGLLRPAADGLYAVIGELAPGGRPENVTIDLGGEEPSMLLRDFLAELLVLFERDRRMLTDLDVESYGQDRLLAKARTNLVDSRRSVYHHEVKAITYHELAVRSIPGGVEATIIVDI